MDLQNQRHAQSESRILVLCSEIIDSNLNIYYRFHKRLLLVLILQEINPLHTLPPYSFEIDFNTIPNKFNIKAT
jgi:hypothetical protein